MKKTAVLFVFSLLQRTTWCLPQKCQSHDFEQPFNGRYFPMKGTVRSKLTWHQCKLFVWKHQTVDLPNNFIDNICSYFISTCPKSISHPSMTFALFTRRQSDECIEWIPMENVHPSEDGRSVSEDNKRFTARMQKHGSDCLGCTLNWVCYSRDEEGHLTSQQGYLCQYLRISDNCAVYYIDYEFGAPLPSSALIGGHNAGGLPVYFVIKEGRNSSKSYIPSSNSFISYDKITTDKVRILVSLWKRLLTGEGQIWTHRQCH